MEDYRETLHLAQFRPAPAEVLKVRAAVRGDQAAMNQYLMVRDGMIPPGNLPALGLQASP
jgi:hypothetical protein